MSEIHFDIVIIGAGISGIGAAYHLLQKCPNKSFVILERRETMGGTWDLFKYPGIRSDSDMFTMGYSFSPWEGAKVLADGGSILHYMKETAERYHITEHIRCNHGVQKAEWSSLKGMWTLTIDKPSKNAQTHQQKDTVSTITCSFLIGCTGYYNYEHGYMPQYPKQETYKGELIHPQKWPKNLQYKDKTVVVIGSGATAVTLVPELAKEAKHVVMLQRSPSYMASLPQTDPVAKALYCVLPPLWAHWLTRWKNIIANAALFYMCRIGPRTSKFFLILDLWWYLLGTNVDVKKHLTPKYKPWDQRLCAVPEYDFFERLKQGKSSIVTDTIECFTEKGILLHESKEELEADIIVSATGLELQLFGGVDMVVDGKRIHPPELRIYKGVLLSGIPNMATIVGYTNSSWTLKVDLACEYIARLLNHMDKRNAQYCCPVLTIDKNNPKDVEGKPILNLSSGYIQRSVNSYPRQGIKHPWIYHQNYFYDLYTLCYESLDDGVLKYVCKDGHSNVGVAETVSLDGDKSD